MTSSDLAKYSITRSIRAVSLRQLSFLSVLCNVKTKSDRTGQPSAAVVVELEDAVLLRVGKVDAAVDAVESELLRRQEIVTAVDEPMHRAVHVRTGDTWDVEMTVR